MCINASRWDCTLESLDNDGRFAVRLGLSMVKGLANAHAATLIGATGDQSFASVDDLWRRAGVPSAALVQLAERMHSGHRSTSRGAKHYGVSRR
ncbi:DNA polymerase III alpha subunit [Nitrobacteraceae bacterium AZCC 1564]